MTDMANITNLPSQYIKASYETIAILDKLDPLPTLELLPTKNIASLSDCNWINASWLYSEAMIYSCVPFATDFYLNILASKAKAHVITGISAMPAKPFAIDWTRVITDNQLESFVDTGFLVIDEVFDDQDVLALQLESGFIEYRDALLTDGIRQPDIRGDRIRWITPDFLAGAGYLQCIDDLGQYFNRTLYTGIRHSEAHYACYPTGFGYQWHYDNPAGRDERVISAVFYLNDDWTAQDGGALAVVDKQGETHRLLPKANRLVLFDSKLYHQVEIAHRQRYSIATWLRGDDCANVVGLAR